MSKFKVGDKVRINRAGNIRYPDYPLNRIFTVETTGYFELAVYRKDRLGWIDESMGLDKYLYKANIIYLGGE